MSVKITRSGDIAVITIDNPPVNALSQAVRAGLVDAIETINIDEGIKGAVITGAGRIFIGGADIKEFGKPPLTPFLPDVIDIIENCRVPTLAAINGAALGGGLEVALGCRYRAGGPKAKTGLPEVNLGLIPGAGGTQRLPRLIGAVKAAEIITPQRFEHVEGYDPAATGGTFSLGWKYRFRNWRAYLKARFGK